jgi:hypothetical protein
MELCRVSIEEEAYDRGVTFFTAYKRAEAKELLQKVEAAARMLLNGVTLSTQRTQYNGAQVVGTYVANYSMRDVAGLFAEQIDEELCMGLMRGEPKTIFKSQRIIGDIAHQCAFEYLEDSSLHSFVDYQDLLDCAENE